MDAFESLQLDFAYITETWLKGGSELKEKLGYIRGASGIEFIHKSRDGRASGHRGGVAVAFNSSTCNFKQRHLKATPKGHEIV